MVNLKSYAIVIVVLNSHISCPSLKHLKEKKTKLEKQKPGAGHTAVSFVSRVNMRGNLIAEFDVTFDLAIYLCSQKYNSKIERSKNLPKCFSLMLPFCILGSKLKLFSCHKFWV